MLHRFKSLLSSGSRSLDKSEGIDIERQVNAELNDAQCKMVRLSLLINPLVGSFVVGVLYNQVSFLRLLYWYILLVSLCGLNFLWSFYYETNKFNVNRLKIWRRGYHIILATLCLTWGSISILFMTDSLPYQLFIITFLQVALVAFNVGAMTDFTSTVINTVFMLLPFLGFCFYSAWISVKSVTPIVALNTAFALSLSILGLFLLLTTFMGSTLIRKFFRLIFENVALSKKLETLNNFLEQRVKERTIELEKSLQLVTYQATHDLLTELPNQRLLLEYADHAIKSADNHSHQFAVIFFTLNEIEKICDGLGHKVGDLVIQTIAKRFQDKFKELNGSPHHKMQYTVTLSRKDVFVILLQPIINVEEMIDMSILFSILNEPVLTENQQVQLTASIGVSLYPQDGTNIQTLLMNSDIAMLRAKQQGGNNLQIYQASINSNISKQLEIQRHLHSAVNNHELILQYQPFVDLTTGAISGVEALVRWYSPELGFVSPADFIPLAESSGSIIPIGEWVMRTACAQVKEWYEQGIKPFKVSVNLSRKQFQQDIVQILTNILNETGAKSKMIQLELTESEAFNEDITPTLKQFKAMGFHLSIDDFGTGYSGLSNLKQFSIDTLKIDQSFIRDLEVSEHSQAIVSHTITLGKQMGIKVLAEGVETKGQLKLLQQYGCDIIQGYYFSPPIDADVLTKLLKSKQRYLL